MYSLYSFYNDGWIKTVDPQTKFINIKLDNNEENKYLIQIKNILNIT